MLHFSYNNLITLISLWDRCGCMIFMSAATNADMPDPIRVTVTGNFDGV